MHALTTQTLLIADHQITFDLPSDQERLLEQCASLKEPVDPYWGILWDAAIDMAGCLLHSDWSPGQTALELGCGAGLVGLAALLAGLEVTFSDMVPEAVELALHNAARNGFAHSNGLILDWQALGAATFDLLLASDVLYARELHAPLLRFAERSLKPGGQFWIGDPGRQQASEFLKVASVHDWKIESWNQQQFAAAGIDRPEFRLMILTR